MSEIITRRRFIIGGATVATGIGVLRLSSDKAAATVAVEELSVPNAEYVLTDESMQDIRISVDTNWSWSGNADATAYELKLKVGTSASNLEEISSKTKDGLGKKSLTGETTLEASLFNSSAFGPDNFSPSQGETTTGLVVAVEFLVKREGEVVESAEATDTAELTIKKEELSYTVELTGTGEWSFESS